MGHGQLDQEVKCFRANAKTRNNIQSLPTRKTQGNIATNALMRRVMYMLHKSDAANGHHVWDWALARNVQTACPV